MSKLVSNIAKYLVFSFFVVCAVAAALLGDILFSIFLVAFLYLLAQSFAWSKNPRFLVLQRPRSCIFIAYGIWTIVSLAMRDASSRYIFDLGKDVAAIVESSKQIKQLEPTSGCTKEEELSDCYLEKMLPKATDWNTSSVMTTMMITGGYVGAIAREGKSKKQMAKSEEEKKVVGLGVSIKLQRGMVLIYQKVYRQPDPKYYQNYLNVLNLAANIGLFWMQKKVEAEFEPNFLKKMVELRKKTELNINEAAISKDQKAELIFDLSTVERI